MTTGEVNEALIEAVYAESEGLEVRGSFEEMGYMGSNDGFVVRAEDGSEFQISIVRSR